MTTAPEDRAGREYGERVAEYLLERVKAQKPHHWRQARRSAGPAPAGCLDTFRTFRVSGISELAFGGLLLVDGGFPILLTETALLPEALLGLQARGSRCVTLLPPGVPAPPPHADGLDFALHDLCHLAKFADPEHHTGQIGFFASLARGFADPAWRAAEAELDSDWFSDRAAVSADMNGSCVFLLSVLKMRLKMAARRRLARRRGVPAPTAGAATPEEEREFLELLMALFDALDLRGELRSAAVATNARRDDPAAARRLVEYFEQLGRPFSARAS